MSLRLTFTSFKSLKLFRTSASIAPALALALGGFLFASSISISEAAPAKNTTEEQCNSGNIKACEMTAQQYLSKQDFKNAAKYLTKVCYSNSPNATKTCAALTTLLIEPSYGLNDINQGHEIADYLCDIKEPYGCVLLSSCYYLGTHVKQDLRNAKKYGERACRLNDKTGCRQLALITYTEAYTEANIAKAEEAFRYYKKACSLGDEDSCNESSLYSEKMEQFKLYTESMKK